RISWTISVSSTSTLYHRVRYSATVYGKPEEVETTGRSKAATCQLSSIAAMSHRAARAAAAASLDRPSWPASGPRAPGLGESPLRSPFPVACALAIIRPLWGAANPMQCHECDAVLPPEARFCFSCGARLEPDAPDSTVDPLLETLKKAI